MNSIDEPQAILSPNQNLSEDQKQLAPNLAPDKKKIQLSKIRAESNHLAKEEPNKPQKVKLS